MTIVMPLAFPVSVKASPGYFEFPLRFFRSVYPLAKAGKLVEVGGVRGLCEAERGLG